MSLLTAWLKLKDSDILEDYGNFEARIFINLCYDWAYKWGGVFEPLFQLWIDFTPHLRKSMPWKMTNSKTIGFSHQLWGISCREFPSDKQSNSSQLNKGQWPSDSSCLQYPETCSIVTWTELLDFYCLSFSVTVHLCFGTYKEIKY